MSSASPADGAAAFVDARGCKAWLATLPLTNVAQAQAQVLEQLRAFNAFELDSLERLKCLELLRDRVAFLLTEARARRGKALPLSPADEQGWESARALLAEMGAGYLRCADAAASGGALAAHSALIAQRIVRYIGAEMLIHAAVYRRFDTSLWARLHGQFASAEAAGIVSERVKDSLEGEEGASSVAEAYCEAALLGSAPVFEMGATQMDFAKALLRSWSRKLRVLAAREDGCEAAMLVDLASSAPGVVRREMEPRATERLIDTTAISRSLRKRVHKLQGGEDAQHLGLPAEAASVDALAELQRLHRAWCEPGSARSAAKSADGVNASLVFGLAEVHFFASGGKPFEQPGSSRELTSREKQDIEVFGRITERTHSKMAAEVRVTAESWPVLDEGAGTVRVMRPAKAARAIALGRIVGARVGSGDFFAGTVSELVQETDGNIVATITLFPGKPQPVAARAVDPGKRAASAWSQALRLPAMEKLGAPASLLVPAGMGARGRKIEIWDAEAAVVGQVLDRGADFERVAIL